MTITVERNKTIIENRGKLYTILPPRRHDGGARICNCLPTRKCMAEMANGLFFKGHSDQHE